MGKDNDNNGGKGQAMESTLISTGECAERKGITRQAVFEAIKRGDIPAIRIGRNFAIKSEDCDAFTPAFTQADKGRKNAGKPRPWKRASAKAMRQQEKDAEGEN